MEQDILTTASAAIAAFSWNDFLTAYIKFSIIFTPVSLIWVIYLLKTHPRQMKAFNDLLDRKLGASQEAPASKEEAKAEKEERPSASVRRNTVLTENSENGIVNIRLKTGDTYRCNLSQKNREDIGNNFIWSTDNPFISSIRPTSGIFKALRAGNAYISCSNVEIYYIEIEPRLHGWFLREQMENMLQRRHIDDIRLGLGRSVKGLHSDDSRRVLTYQTERGSITYGYGANGEVTRFMLQAPPQESTVTEISEGIREYMMPLADTDRQYWIHRSPKSAETDYPDSVDYVAFVRRSPRGVLYFGICECWRMGASSQEVHDNLEMADRLFADLMDSADVPDVLGSETAPAAARKKTAAGAEAEAAEGKKRPERKKTKKTAEQQKPHTNEPAAVPQDTIPPMEDENIPDPSDPNYGEEPGDPNGMV